MAESFDLENVEVSLTPLERFEEFLQSRGKRITQQRRRLVERVFQRHEHFDADELIADVSVGRGSDRISRPTVYRTLSELVESGLLRKFVVAGRLVYEHDYGYPQHDHLHCNICDCLIEFQSDELISLRNAVAKEHQFRITGHRLLISGTCRDCRQRLRRKKRPVDLI
jgi:Fur family ferric uptake transcriptional regulator